MLGKFFDEIDFLEVEKFDFEKIDKYTSNESSVIIDQAKNDLQNKYARTVLKSSNMGLEPIMEEVFEYKEIETPPKGLNHTISDLALDSERIKEMFSHLNYNEKNLDEDKKTSKCFSNQYPKNLKH